MTLSLGRSHMNWSSSGEIFWGSFTYMELLCMLSLTDRSCQLLLLVSWSLMSPTFIMTQYFTAFFFAIIGSYGISSGAHRLWCHRTYKANRKMQYMLLFFQTVAFQNSCIEWVRDHRVHHKYSDTNADPHNASRGFFFSHIGWLLCKLLFWSSKQKLIYSQSNR